MQLPDDLYTEQYRDRRKSPKRLVSFHWRQRWRAWIKKRLPAQRTLQLHNKNLFIFPSRAGLGFIFLILLLLLVAINFENSAVYAMVFLLSGIFVISILHTFFNLSGLKITGLDGEPTFSGREAVFYCLLTGDKRSHLGVQLSWQNLASERVDLAPFEEKRLAIRFRTGPRGYCKPGRVKIESCYPLGLIRCWTWVDLKQQVLVYPTPDIEAGTPRFTNELETNGDFQSTHSEYRPGSDDFYALREYIPGDNIKNIAWKNYAKSDQLYIKQFVDQMDRRISLDWTRTHGNIEQRLRQLCHWALQLESGRAEYGLIMPGLILEPGRGSQHLGKLLGSLATFNMPTKAYTTNQGVEQTSSDQTMYQASS